MNENIPYDQLPPVVRGVYTKVRFERATMHYPNKGPRRLYVTPKGAAVFDRDCWLEDADAVGGWRYLSPSNLPGYSKP